MVFKSTNTYLMVMMRRVILARWLMLVMLLMLLVLWLMYDLLWYLLLLLVVGRVVLWLLQYGRVFSGHRSVRIYLKLKKCYEI